mmetsp:Transcript_51335/g.92488  ORF Transcript_51335/g.92488 Transcript_51335/m.92488 type:complete len:313 (-) Transcript_51335:1843-2781(-)
MSARTGAMAPGARRQRDEDASASEVDLGRVCWDDVRPHVLRSDDWHTSTGHAIAPCLHLVAIQPACVRPVLFWENQLLDVQLHEACQGTRCHLGDTVFRVKPGSPVRGVEASHRATSLELRRDAPPVGTRSVVNSRENLELHARLRDDLVSRIHCRVHELNVFDVPQIATAHGFRQGNHILLGLVFARIQAQGAEGCRSHGINCWLGTDPVLARKKLPQRQLRGPNRANEFRIVCVLPQVNADLAEVKGGQGLIIERDGNLNHEVTTVIRMLSSGLRTSELSAEDVDHHKGLHSLSRPRRLPRLVHQQLPII